MQLRFLAYKFRTESLDRIEQHCQAGFEFIQASKQFSFVVALVTHGRAFKLRRHFLTVADASFIKQLKQTNEFYQSRRSPNYSYKSFNIKDVPANDSFALTCFTGHGQEYRMDVAVVESPIPSFSIRELTYDGEHALGGICYVRLFSLAVFYSICNKNNLNCFEFSYFVFALFRFRRPAIEYGIFRCPFKYIFWYIQYKIFLDFIRLCDFSYISWVDVDSCELGTVGVNFCTIQDCSILIGATINCQWDLIVGYFIHSLGVFHGLVFDVLDSFLAFCCVKFEFFYRFSQPDPNNILELFHRAFALVYGLHGVLLPTFFDPINRLDFVISWR
ncbi:hypothetical protein HDU98_006698 [Podochytrium sp. JEL0797]|nr:hypothetical protein HDU98_006698 [Podochytrium sp. JEL0797]